MPRSSSMSYLGNPKLKAEGVKQSLTLKQIEEYQKCFADPIHFIRNYVKIIGLDKGTIYFDLWPFQERMIGKFMNNRFVIIKLPRQVGKCLQQDACIYIRDRETGEEKYVTIKKFYNLNKSSVFKNMWELCQGIGRFLRSKSEVLFSKMSKNGSDATCSGKEICQIQETRN